MELEDFNVKTILMMTAALVLAGTMANAEACGGCGPLGTAQAGGFFGLPSSTQAYTHRSTISIPVKGLNVARVVYTNQVNAGFKNARIEVVRNKARDEVSYRVVGSRTVYSTKASLVGTSGVTSTYRDFPVGMTPPPGMIQGNPQGLPGNGWN